MDLKNVIRWINKNYPEVLIIRRGSNFGTKKLELLSGGKMTIDFSEHINGHGCIISNSVSRYVYGAYEKIIVLFDYEKTSENVWTLLHELGHHTSYQSSDTIQNEINAWEDALKLGNKIGINPSPEDIIFMQNCLYSYLDYHTPNNKHWDDVIRIGLFRKPVIDWLQDRFYCNLLSKIINETP